MSTFDIGSIIGSKNYSGFVNSTDPFDLYNFNVSRTGSFQLSLSGLSANADIQLLNSSGATIASSTRTGSLSEGIFDTSSPMGEAIFQIIAILKTMEVNVLRERTIKGIEAARARGVKGGRPAGSYNKKKASAIVTLYKQKESINFIEETQNVSRSTIYQYLRKEGVTVNGFKKKKNINS